MDKVTYSILGKMRLENVRLIALEDFEDDALRKVKQERTSAEYCWTCTPALALYVMQREPAVNFVAYLDADLFFYSDPRPIYDELCKNSILIIEHRFSPEYKGREKDAGIYNVSMVVFRNDRYGIECLKWWNEQCLKACSRDPVAGLCGDQKYLDDWPSRFENVVVLQHKGGGLAPWNMSNYRLHSSNGKVFVDSDELIFYHFHQLQIVDPRLLTKRVFLPSTGYDFTGQQLALVYLPYVRELRRVIKKVEEVSPGFSWGRIRISLRDLLLAFRKGDLLFA